MSLENTEYSFKVKDALVGAQMLFVAFGALVLVPLLTGLDPNVALLTAGVGTLIFQVLTKRSVPIFLASSFAFIAPIIYGVKTWGIAGTMAGLAAAGVVYMLLALIIKWRGSEFLLKILPPIVTGPVIMVIGLKLASIAGGMAMGDPKDGSSAIVISMVTLAVTVSVSILGKGMMKLVPILIGIIAGYIVSLFYGIVEFQPVIDAAWLRIPNFTFPEWNTEAIFYIIPVAIAPAIEHFGDILAIGQITGKNYLKTPGIHRTMMGDGVATTFAAFLGGPPNTTYSEVTGAVALTKSYNPGIMTWAAISAIILAFVGKLGALLQTVPTPVMGGIMLLLFGAIMVVGLNSLVKAGDDLMDSRNLTIVALIIIFGIGGMSFSFGSFKLEGIGLAGILGIFLNLVLPKTRK